MNSEEVIELISEFLAAARLSVERHVRIQRAGSVGRFTELVMMIEQLRFLINSRPIDYRKGTPEELAFEDEVTGEFLRVANSIDHIGGRIPWVGIPRPRSKSPKIVKVLLSDPPSGEPLGAVANYLSTEIGRRRSYPRAQPQLFDVLISGTEARQKNERLRRIVPEQRISPVRFEIVRDRLMVDHQSASPLPQDHAMASEARETLRDAGAKIITELEKSNCDRRLLDNAIELQTVLKSEKDIIRLGLLNNSCTVLREAFEQELPTAVNALIKSQGVNINIYLAQFPDWRKFNEQADKVALDGAAIAEVAESTKALIEALKKHKDVVDPEVPRTIAAILDMVRDPKKTTKRYVLALVRTVENLVARTYKYLSDFIEKTIEKTIDSASATVAKHAVILLSVAALSVASHFIPAAVTLAGANWMKEATDIVRQQVELLQVGK